MNKKNKALLLGLLFIPAGAILLNACGPQEAMDSELALDTAASDNFGLSYYNRGLVNPFEYGRCRDTWDNDGDGLSDMADPDCHIMGPLRDLSLYDFPVGHNYFPDTRYTAPLSPGARGGFRDRSQMTRWFRFLTEPDGAVAGTEIMGPGVNPEVVPIPAPLVGKVRQGTYAQGNNNNVDIRDLNRFFLQPVNIPSGFIDGPPDAEVNPILNKTRGIPGNWPGLFYKGGSQGFLQSVRENTEHRSRP